MTQHQQPLIDFILFDNCQIETHLQHFIDFAIAHLDEVDDELLYDSLPTVNHLCKLMRNYKREGTLLSEV
jgi:hypothetical protein